MNDAMMSATPKKTNPFRITERSFRRLFLQRACSPRERHGPSYRKAAFHWFGPVTFVNSTGRTIRHSSRVSIQTSRSAGCPHPCQTLCKPGTPHDWSLT